MYLKVNLLPIHFSFKTFSRRNLLFKKLKPATNSQFQLFVVAYQREMFFNTIQSLGIAIYESNPLS